MCTCWELHNFLNLGHCCLYLLLYIDFCVVLAFYHSNHRKPTFLKIWPNWKEIMRSNAKTINFLELAICSASGRCWVSLCYPPKIKTSCVSSLFTLWPRTPWCTVWKLLGQLYKFFFLSICLFIYLWLCWVFVSARGLSLVVASGGHSSSRCTVLSPSRPLPWWSTGSRRADSVIVAHGPSRSAARGIPPDQGSNPCPLHWQADSQTLHHQGSPKLYKFIASPHVGGSVWARSWDEGKEWGEKNCWEKLS